MAYWLRIYDNFHYMDEEEVYDYRRFLTYDDALQEAKSIVEEFILNEYQPEMDAAYLASRYTMFGDDPVICSDGDPLPTDHFFCMELRAPVCRAIHQRFEDRQITTTLKLSIY